MNTRTANVGAHPRIKSGAGSVRDRCAADAGIAHRVRSYGKAA